MFPLEEPHIVFRDHEAFDTHWTSRCLAPYVFSNSLRSIEGASKRKAKVIVQQGEISHVCLELEDLPDKMADKTSQKWFNIGYLRGSGQHKSANNEKAIKLKGSCKARFSTISKNWMSLEVHINISAENETVKMILDKRFNWVIKSYIS